MLTDEDVEALLYAQVYYGKSAEESGITVTIEESSNANEENMNNIGQQENEDQPTNLKQNPDSTQNLDPNLPLDNLQCSEISTSDACSASSSTTLIAASPENPIIDNPPYININQGFCPGPNFTVRLQEWKRKLTWSDQCEQALKNHQAGLINEKQFFKVLKLALFKQKLLRKKQEKIRQPTISSEIIYLSDSSANSDIEIVSVETKIMKLKDKEVTQINDSGDENDIIYVEPPPAVIISVDEESDGNEEPLQEPPAVEVPSLHMDEEASNDFLPAATTSAENFNFSLHGSEFHDAEFVRPANPTDHYETESSTSTSDFNRDSSREFSNTVKTIVFNEVDFPKDIFDESNNLEKFGELITPKRKDKSAQSDDGLGKAGTSGSKKRINPRTSSESSSESDYDASESHQHLPHLSPMTSVGSSQTKKGKSLIHNKQRRLKENQEIMTEEEASAEHKSKRKGKRKNTGDRSTEDYEAGTNSNDSDAPTSSAQLKDTAPTIDTEEIAKKAETPKKTIKKKNKKQKTQAQTVKSLISEANELMKETHRLMGELSTSKGRTRSQTVSAGECAESNLLKRKKRKKKKKPNKDVENNILEDHNEGVNQIDAVIDLIISDDEQNEILKSCDDVVNKVPESSKMADDRMESTTEDNIKKRKSNNNFERNNNKEPEKNKKKRILSDKRNSVEEKKVNQDKEKVKETKIDEEGDILIIEKTIPLHVIESSESEDDISNFGNLGEELQLANVEIVENDNKSQVDEFDVEQLQSKMSDDPLKWEINILDKNQVKNRASGARCRKCRQIGHIAVYCPNKQLLPRCTLCGFEGHEEPRCSKKVCFTCGANGKFSTVYCYRCVNQRKVKCALCYLIGHSKDSCPDLWRRYFLTTERGPVVEPKDKSLKPRNQRWCSGCAENGHFEYQCKSYKWIREYPASSPVIFNYHDVYNNIIIPKPRDLRERLDLNRDNMDLREKLNYRKRNSRTNQDSMVSNQDSMAPTTETARTDNTNAQPQTSKTCTDSSKVSEPDNPQPSTIPSTDSSLPPEVPQCLEVSQPENPIPHLFAELIQPPRGLNLPQNQLDMNRDKSKGRRQSRNQRPNPVSLMYNRHTPYESRQPWLSNRYESVLNPYSEMNDGPYSNRIQSFPNQIQPYPNQIQPYPIQIQPYPNQIQPLNWVDRGPVNMMPYNNYYEHLQNHDFTQDVEPWNNNNPQMPVNSGLNFQTPVLDFSDSVPDNRHLPVVHSSTEDSLNFPYTITREPSPRLSDHYREQQPVPLQIQPSDGLASQQQQANIENDNQPPVVSLCIEEPIKPIELPKDNEGSKLEATAEKFSSFSKAQLQIFLESELEKLDKIKNPDPKVYRKKLNVINQLKKVEVKTNVIRKQMYFHFKHINMYLFGVQRLEKGHKNLTILRNFVHQPGYRLLDSKRESLLGAFNYIFGGEHPNFNYMKHLNNLCAESSSKKAT